MDTIQQLTALTLGQTGTRPSLLWAQRQPPTELLALVKYAQPALKQLLTAKSESDRRNYSAKHTILRDLIRAKPDDFLIDSEEGDIVGITHRPTGFRLHLPKQVLPVPLSRSLPVAQPAAS